MLAEPLSRPYALIGRGGTKCDVLCDGPHRARFIRSPDEGESMYTDVLIPTDGSQGAQAAIEHGLEIAQQSEATVHALYVVDTRVSRSGPLLEPLRQEGREAVRDVEVAGAQTGLDVITEIVEGVPAEVIL